MVNSGIIKKKLSYKQNRYSGCHRSTRSKPINTTPYAQLHKYMCTSEYRMRDMYMIKIYYSAYIEKVLNM